LGGLGIALVAAFGFAFVGRDDVTVALCCMISFVILL
jgi:hypothetical protein